METSSNASTRSAGKNLSGSGQLQAGSDAQAVARKAATNSESGSQTGNARSNELQETLLTAKLEAGDYDVFMCYNSKDEQQVMAIGRRLKNRGILPWLAPWETRPGTRWQKELTRQLRSIKSVAVFIGERGSGPWQELEVEAALEELAKRGRPIIPVILEGRRGSPRLPAFLNLLHRVDMRQPYPDPFEMLIFGITGQRPSSL